MPPVSVRAVKALSSDVPLEVAAIGNVEAMSSVDVKPRTTGQIVKVLFQEGADVQKGQILFELDPEPLTRQIAELEANLARDRANEKQAEANVLKDEAQLRNSQAQADRGLKLSKEGIFSREQTDQLVATADAAKASLDADRAAAESSTAAIRADGAKLAQTKLQMSYTKVVAPESGRAGAIMAKEGNLAKENDTTLVTILQVDPVYVSFSVPEQVLPEVRPKVGVAPLEVTAVGGDGATLTGSLHFIDNTVDTTTGMIRLKAIFHNAQRKLWPGQFVNVHAQVALERGRILVPSRTVQNGPKGRYVWVVGPDSTVSMRDVQVLRNFTGSSGEQAVIAAGLTPGDVVISEGQMRLAPGAKVKLLEPARES